MNDTESTETCQFADKSRFAVTLTRGRSKIGGTVPTRLSCARGTLAFGRDFDGPPNSIPNHLSNLELEVAASAGTKIPFVHRVVAKGL
jgi:hypothetical protein